MKQYLDLLEDILENGEVREDRTGTGTKSVFGRQLRFNLQKGFPLITTKKMGIKSIYAELLWFLEGSTDERRLAEIQYGTRDLLKKTIWTDNAMADYWKDQSKFVGDLGRVYGAQWRAWMAMDNVQQIGHAAGDHNAPVAIVDVRYVDQIKNVIDSLKGNPWSRRHLVVAYNPGEVDNMCLPPCHCFFQFWVSASKKLSCQFYMRSNDVPLGLPYNIASYALLTHMIAQVCELDVGDLCVSLGDAHIYLDQINAIKEQLQREPYELPHIFFDKKITDIDDFKLDSLSLEGYRSHSKLDIPFSV